MKPQGGAGCSGFSFLQPRPSAEASPGLNPVYRPERTHDRKHSRTHGRTHSRKHGRTHSRTHGRTYSRALKSGIGGKIFEVAATVLKSRQ